MEFLTEEWLDAVREVAAGSLSGLEGMSVSANFEVKGSRPSKDSPVSKQKPGKLSLHAVLQDGKLTVLESGKSQNADCQISGDWGDFRAIVSGEDSWEVAYMQGRLKIDGDYGIILYTLRPLYEQPEWQQFVSEVQKITE